MSEQENGKEKDRQNRFTGGDEEAQAIADWWEKQEKENKGKEDPPKLPPSKIH